MNGRTGHGTAAESTLLRIFVGEEDQTEDGKLLYEAIVNKAREMQMAGATVLRGPLGFGHSSILHTAKILRLSQDLPTVIEIVDARKNRTLYSAGDEDDPELPHHDGKVQVIHYGSNGSTKEKAINAPSCACPQAAFRQPDCARHPGKEERPPALCAIRRSYRRSRPSSSQARSVWR
ncbi:DUF190 domain-containing protein [Brucella suis bv. 1]|nr:DUF190 domain-containing protein [Brucella suis bv. 1]